MRFNRAVHALAAEAEAREERAQRVAERAAELRPVDADAEVETERELTRSQALVEELGDSEGF